MRSARCPEHFASSYSADCRPFEWADDSREADVCYSRQGNILERLPRSGLPVTTKAFVKQNLWSSQHRPQNSPSWWQEAIENLEAPN